VHAAVATAAELTAVPADLMPPVQLISKDDSFTSYGCELRQAATTNGTCLYGDPTGSKKLILVGDSQAGAWFPAFDLMAKRIHWQLELLSKPACPMPDLPFFYQEGKRPNTECTVWHSYVIKRINAEHPDAIVLIDASFEQGLVGVPNASASQWYTGLQATLGRLRKGPALYMLGDVPVLQQSTPDCLAEHETSVKTCDTPVSEALAGVRSEAERKAIDGAGGKFIDARSWFCSSVCTPIIADRAVFRERFHISATYARYLTGVVQEAMGLS
jgi:hypothetical protein